MTIDKDNMPQHIAIIMDGNRRWARKKGLSAVTGHDYVADRVLEPLVDRCIELGIPYITFWAFSTENWERNKVEVRGMMQIFRRGLKRSAKRLFEKGKKRLTAGLTGFILIFAAFWVWQLVAIFFGLGMNFPGG